MTWRGRLARTAIAAVLTAGGCMSRLTSGSALPSNAVPPRPPAAVGREEQAEVARPQKPDAVKPPTNSAVSLIGKPLQRPSEAAKAHPTAAILAVVNGEPILQEEVRANCIAELIHARTAAEHAEIMKKGLERVIDREVVLQDAVAKLERGGKQGLALLAELRKAAEKEYEKRFLKPLMKQNQVASKQEFAALMKEKYGLQLEVWKRDWERNFMSQQYLSARIDPYLTRIGHTQIVEYYQSHREEYTQPDSVHWRDIFIDAGQHASPADARAFAESLVRRVRQGEDFAKLSEEFDNGTSGKYRKGDGKGQKRGEIHPKEVEPILFGMREGDIEIFPYRNGFHIVQVVKRQYAGPVPFDANVQKEIQTKLRIAVIQTEMKGLVDQLKRKAVIDPPVR